MDNNYSVPCLGSCMQQQLQYLRTRNWQRLRLLQIIKYPSAPQGVLFLYYIHNIKGNFYSKNQNEYPKDYGELFIGRIRRTYGNTQSFQLL